MAATNDSSAEWLFAQNARIAKALAMMFHPLVEAVVQDYRSKRPGIFAIYGGHVTGRKVGDPLTELGKHRARGKAVADDLISYPTQTASGRRMKSTSLAIRDQNGRLLGALCINVDLTVINEVHHLLGTLTSCGEIEVPRLEKFRSRAPREEVEAALVAEVRRRGLIAKQLTQQEREEIVETLAQQGLLSRRGAVTIIARTLGVTRPTVYRYIRGSRGHHGH